MGVHNFCFVQLITGSFCYQLCEFVFPLFFGERESRETSIHFKRQKAQKKNIALDVSTFTMIDSDKRRSNNNKKEKTVCVNRQGICVGPDYQITQQWRKKKNIFKTFLIKFRCLMFRRQKCLPFFFSRRLDFFDAFGILIKSLLNLISFYIFFFLLPLDQTRFGHLRKDRAAILEIYDKKNSSFFLVNNAM